MPLVLAEEDTDQISLLKAAGYFLTEVELQQLVIVEGTSVQDLELGLEYDWMSYLADSSNSRN